MNKSNKPWPCLKCFVMMVAIDNDHCKCPVCRTEVWYDYDEPPDMDIDEIESLMQESYNRHPQPPDVLVLGGGYAKIGGGSKSKGRSKKQLMKKPSTKELYNKLSNTKSPLPRKSSQSKNTVDI